MTIRVLLADQNGLMRDALRRVLSADPELTVVAEAEDGQTAVRMALRHLPDVVLIDLSMAQVGGLPATRAMLAEEPGLRVLVVSLHTDREMVRAALEAGAIGYVAKDAAARELTAAVRAVAAGRVYLCRAAAGAAVAAAEAAEGRPRVATFTAPEREVLDLLARGRSGDEAAAHLGLAADVLRARLRRIVEKLTCHAAAGTGLPLAPTGEADAARR